MTMDPQDAFAAADRDYRAAEKRKAGGLDLPYLVTLNFRSSAEAHEFIESIKEHGGVITMAAGMHTKTVPAGVMDFREWGGESEIFGPKWPNHPEA
jgi:hypothetical protein